MESDATPQEFAQLHSGDPLTGTYLRTVTARDDTTVVLLAGPVASGKTTILVSLYELFSEGPVAGVLFAGSLTLVGFELIAHTGRLPSGLTAPDTFRTNPSSDPGFLHLRVADIGSGSPKLRSLLLSDITGEAFLEATDVSQPTVVSADLWKRANILCVILDGQDMSLPKKRHLARNSARSLLHAACDAARTSSTCHLVIATTKWDLVTSKETEDYVQQTESVLIAQFGAGFQSVSCHHIAARPTSHDVPYAHGVPSLLTQFLVHEPAQTVLSIPKFLGGSGPFYFAQAMWLAQRTVVGGALDVI